MPNTCSRRVSWDAGRVGAHGRQGEQGRKGHGVSSAPRPSLTCARCLPWVNLSSDTCTLASLSLLPPPPFPNTCVPYCLAYIFYLTWTPRARACAWLNCWKLLRFLEEILCFCCSCLCACTFILACFLSK